MPDLDLDPFLLLPLALVLCLMALPVISRKIWGPVAYVPVHEVYGRMKKGEPIAVIDLRDAAAFQKGAVPGATNLPAQDIEDFLSDKKLSETPVALVCQSDLSATRHAARLLQQGHTNVAAMKGGVFAWKRAKYPLEQPT